MSYDRLKYAESSSGVSNLNMQISSNLITFYRDSDIGSEMAKEKK